MHEPQPPADTPPAAYRCGAFMIVPASRRLYRGGDKVDLEAKVFDLILLLVDNRDRALGKQEVVTALWGHRPVTDAALSQLLYKARRALDDDGDQQSVIRTVYGRGLQWVAPLAEMDSGSIGIGQSASATTVAEPPEPPTHDPGPLSGRRRWWFAIGALAILAVLSIWIIPRSFAPPAPPKPRVALLPMDNGTGDATLDWTARGLPGLIASLLGDSHDLDVVDPLQVARVWGFTPPKGHSQAEHTRFVTGADVLVSGRLEKAAGELYQLTLHVDTGDAQSPSDIVITGIDPGSISLAAVARLRHVLKLDPPAAPPFRDKPRDAYLAETFARGIDLAMHGDWQGAKPYFVLVNQADAAFMSARFLLARAQANTDELREADAGYAALLADARRLGQPALAARVLADQVVQATNRHENTNAKELATQAIASARQTDNPEILAGALLTAANINARLRQVDLAQAQYDQARTLIEKKPMRELQPRLHNTMAYIAKEKNDPAAAIAAARAELAADQAIGKERSSMIASFNLAYALSNSDRPLESLPLLAHVWNWSRLHHDNALQVAAGNLAISLVYDMGVYREILPVIDATAQLAETQGNRYIQAQALGLHAGAAYSEGDLVASLAISRKVSGLIDPAQDPSTAIWKLSAEAFAALAAAPAEVAEISKRVDQLVAQMPDPAEVLPAQYMVRAMAAAANGDRKGVRSAFDATSALPHVSADYLHQIALQIALIRHDDDIAVATLHDFNPASPGVSADTLRLYITWALRRGDKAGQQQAADQLDAMRRNALDALANASFQAAGEDPGNAMPEHPISR